MDDHTKKRPSNGPEFSKRCSDLSFGKQKHEEGTFHECKRKGCSTDHNSNKNTQSRSSEKITYLKPPLRSKSSNPNATSSSRSSSSSINLNMSCHGSQNGKSLEEAHIADCINGQAENENRLKFDLEFPGRKKVTEFSRSFKPPILHCFPSISPAKISSHSKPTFASRDGKQISQRSVSATLDNVNPPFCQSSIPRFACQIPKSIPQCAIGRAQRYGLKTLGFESISDAPPTGSASDGHDKRTVSLRKKFQNGEGYSSGMPSLEVQQVPHDTSRTKNQYNGRDTTVSFRTCPSSEGESSRMMSNEEEDEHIFELPGPILFPTRSHTPLIISEAVQERAPRLFDFQNTSFARRPRSQSQSSRHRSVSNFVDVDDYLHLNMEGIAEVCTADENYADHMTKNDFILKVSFFGIPGSTSTGEDQAR